MAEGGDEVQAPKDRDRALSVAYLRLTGSSQEEAATAAGVGERTVARWETCSWWPGFLDEAGDRWLAGVKARARKALIRILDASDPDPATVRFSLERLLPGFEPPKVKAELSGVDGDAIAMQVEVTRRTVSANHANRVAPFLTGNGAGHS